VLLEAGVTAVDVVGVLPTVLPGSALATAADSTLPPTMAPTARNVVAPFTRSRPRSRVAREDMEPVSAFGP